jgi:hypothetical protein
LHARTKVERVRIFWGYSAAVLQECAVEFSEATSVEQCFLSDISVLELPIKALQVPLQALLDDGATCPTEQTQTSRWLFYRASYKVLFYTAEISTHEKEAVQAAMSMPAT